MSMNESALNQPPCDQQRNDRQTDAVPTSQLSTADSASYAVKGGTFENAYFGPNHDSRTFNTTDETKPPEKKAKQESSPNHFAMGDQEMGAVQVSLPVQIDAPQSFSSTSSDATTYEVSGSYESAVFGPNIDKRTFNITVNNYGRQDSGKMTVGAPDVITYPSGIKVFSKKLIYEAGSGKNIYQGEKETSEGNFKLAVKVFPPYNKDALDEAKSLEAICDHPNVVQIFGIGLNPIEPDNYIFIAMERCSQKTLYDYVNENEDFDPQLAIRHSTQIISGLEYIHAKGVAHRDLKPQNILFFDDESYEKIKIADFGVAKNYLVDRFATKSTALAAGTTGFTAPEIVREEQVTDLRICDIFSLGILLVFRLSNGNHPYGKRRWEWEGNIGSGRKPNFSEILLPDARQRNAAVCVIDKMLQDDPENRPTVAELYEEWKKEVLGEVAEGNDVDDIAPAADADAEEETGSETERSNGNDQRVMGEESFQTPCIIGFTGGKLTHWNSVDQLDSEPTNVADLITTIEDQTFTAVAVDHRVSVLTWLKRCYEFDLDYPNMGWIQLDSMIHLHGNYPPATVLKGEVYACGGGWEWGGYFRKENMILPIATRNCEMLRETVLPDITGLKTRRQWHDMKPMKEERGHNCVVSLEDCVYSIAGWDINKKPLKTVEKYDPTKNTWDYTGKLNKSRYNAAAVAYNGKLYVIGGLNAMHEPIDSIECLDPSTSEWTLLKKKLPHPDDRISAFVFDGKIITLMGYGKFTTVQELPLEEEENQIESCKPYTGWLDAAIAVK